MAEEEQDMDVEQQQESLATNTSRGFCREDYGPIEVPTAPETVATYDINGPRMIITHIDNENFKSYAGMQRLGPFHKSFTSIVGPNGSGKSNVIDSMLFVFGYRAHRIRSKKISVLIHNSENHRDIECCTVTVHFQKIVDTGPEEDEYTVVPDSHIAVSRTAFKDNSSHYCINGKRAQYKEVATLLRASGIDLDHNRFLILQGEVEQIAMMKPKGLTEHEDGMLEYLEDIVGSNRFKEPIDTLAKRVELLNELRVEKLNRVKAVEAEKDNLEGAKNEALAYIRIENALAKLKHQVCQKYIYDNKQAVLRGQEALEKVQEQLKEVNKQVAVLEEEKTAKSKEHKASYKKHEVEKKRMQDARDKYKECELADLKCQEDIKHLTAKSKKMEKTLAQERKKIAELKEVPETCEKAVAEAKKKLEKLETKKKEEDEHLQKVMESLKTETQGLQEEKDKKEEVLIGLKEAVNETKSKYDLGQSELDLYLSNQQSETQKLEEMQKNLAKAESTIKERQSEMAEIKKQLPVMEKALARAREDLKTAEAADAKITEEVRALRTKVEEARSNFQASKSRNHVLNALMEEKKQGRLPGIYGRLGDLGGIDEKYDVAISTACGALDNIVVDSINTAQRCVEFLKKNNVGSATFIGLDKMQRWVEYTKKKINTPENVPRLFDLVKVADEAVLPAFYFALRDTLVAKDLDQATRIAFGKTRYRVVTLTGDLIDQSGTMSGGGKTVCRGRMGASAKTEMDPKEVANMENRLQKATAESQQCRQNREKLEDLISQNQKSITQMKHNQEKFEIDVKALGEQVVSLRSQIKEQEVKVKAAAPDEKELSKLRSKVEACKKEYQKAADAASKIEAEVQKLHSQIMEIGGAKLKAAQGRVDAVASQIDTIEGQITKANVEVKTSERNLKKAESKVETLEEEIKECKEKVKELEKQMAETEEKATAWVVQKNEAEGKEKELADALKELQGELDKLEKDETALQKELVNIRNEEHRLCDNMQADHGRILHWQQEMGNQHLTPIEGEEETGMLVLDDETLHTLELKKVRYGITVHEEELNQLKPNMAAIAEYKKKEELYLQRVAELDEITEVRDAQRHMHEDFRKQRLNEFMAGFTVITNKLKEMYQMITLGGDAELELVDSLDPFSEGIVFSVRPPKKSWKNISNLSGGEKTLSSLALVFALHHYKPTPLYVMDEIDAALDFKNVSIVANYIKERTRNAQFIIISLRNNMFELADRLVGIYKTDNCTKSVTINPAKMSLPLREVNGGGENCPT